MEKKNSTIEGKISENNNVFEYVEIKTGRGKGPRGIKITVNGGITCTYRINPNPHNYTKYTNGSQATFYKNAAEKLVKDFIKNDAFSAFGSEFSFGKNIYTLDQPPRKLILG